MHQLLALTKPRILFIGPEFWGSRPKNYRHEGSEVVKIARKKDARYFMKKV